MSNRRDASDPSGPAGHLLPGSAREETIDLQRLSDSSQRPRRSPAARIGAKGSSERRCA